MEGATSSSNKLTTEDAKPLMSMCFQKSKSFDQIVNLPIRGQFLFHEDDILISESLFCYWKKKKLFFSTRGHGSYRELAVTYDGHLICYTDRAVGYVLAIDEAISIRSAPAQAFYGRNRVVLTLKFNFGSFYIYASNTRAYEWMSVLQRINVGLKRSNPSDCSTKSNDSRRVNFQPSMVTLWEESSLRVTELSVLDSETAATLEDEEKEMIMSKDEQVGQFVVAVRDRIERKSKKIFEKKKKFHIPDGFVQYTKTRYEH